MHHNTEPSLDRSYSHAENRTAPVLEDELSYTQNLIYSGGGEVIPTPEQPVLLDIPEGVSAKDTAAERAADRTNEVFKLRRDPKTFEVFVDSDLELEDWEKITKPEDWSLMMDWASDLKGELAKKPEDKRSVVFINPTMEGGGVAMMRPPLIHILRKLGIDAHWYVMEGPKKGEPNVFEFTKQVHNTIQDRLTDDVRITANGKRIHRNWVAENAKTLLEQPAIRNAAIGVLDDPQPAPFARLWKHINPDIKLGWRNHIHNFGKKMMDPSTPQGEVHQYLQNELGLRDFIDFYFYHPDINNDFVPEDTVDKAHLAPATIEAHDDMNRELSPEEREVGVQDINDQITRKNEVAIKEGRFDDIQEQLDINRDRIVLIARFDESKAMDKAMAFGALIRQKVMEKREAEGITDKKPPQIVLIGNGSADDPSGEAMLDHVLKLRREEFSDIKEDIIVQRLLHNYVAINAAMYNDSEEAALLAMQMSDAEGCETRISDWINHGVFTFVANVGGMPLQVVEGESGTILDYTKPDLDFNRGAELASTLMVDRAAYETARQKTLEASQLNKRDYSTTMNAARFMRAFNYALRDQKPDKMWRAEDLLKQKNSIRNRFLNALKLKLGQGLISKFVEQPAG